MGKLAVVALLAAGASFHLWGEQARQIRVPAGEFTRGRTFAWPDYEVAWYPNPAKDDLPARRIYLDEFEVDVTEITNERYAEFVKATGHRAPFHWLQGKPPADGSNHPVVNVSWDDATAYCAWSGKRLPTEAEWERAARGNAEGKMYTWGDRDPTAKEARYNRLDGPGPVCSFARNDFGLCDMAGNVWEWCSDWYGQKYYEVSPDRNPSGPETGLYRVLRGGSWFDVPKLFLTVPYRSWARAAERSPTIGFRCARSVKP
jgi:formylglycine-generating enzyme required for sulfatase activity